MRIIAGYNIKGGVGKTATVVNLSYLCAKEGYKTLIWDLDPQGAASYYLRIKPKVKGGGKRLISKKNALDEAIKGTDYHNLDLLPADFSYRNMDFLLEDEKKPENRLRKVLQPIAGEYDFIFLDCAPGISLTSENVLRASNVVLVPTIPTTLSLRTLGQLIKFCKNNKITSMDVIPLFSMVDRRKTLHRMILENPPKTPDPALKNWIPYASDIEKMGIHREPVGSFSPSSVAARAYEAVWKELKKRMKIK
ncbi:MAG: AAA family ATPase [Gammaproteobacteria bacterium]|nr:AAA family ATPase [Gammaproteobacteria bacterium]